MSSSEHQNLPASERVDLAWQRLLQGTFYKETLPIVFEAAKHPELRQLFPFTAHAYFGLSHCTEYPYTHDIPKAFPLENSEFELVLNRSSSLFRGTAEEVAEKLKDYLPKNCGPAKACTAEKLI